MDRKEFNKIKKLFKRNGIDIYQNTFGNWVVVLDTADYYFPRWDKRKSIDVDNYKTYAIYQRLEDAIKDVMRYIEIRS